MTHLSASSEAAFAYLTDEHNFELYRGDMPFGRFRRMTGFRAKRLNEKYEEQYAAKCLQEPKRRLWKWKLLRSEQERKVYTEIARRAR